MTPTTPVNVDPSIPATCDLTLGFNIDPGGEGEISKIGPKSVPTILNGIVDT